MGHVPENWELNAFIVSPMDQSHGVYYCPPQVSSVVITKNKQPDAFRTTGLKETASILAESLSVPFFWNCHHEPSWGPGGFATA